MTYQVSPAKHGGVETAREASHGRGDATSRATTDEVWKEIAKASFAVVSYVTPRGEPRSSGIVYGTHGRHLYMAVATDGWKARQIRDGQQLAVTLPVRRGGLLSLVVPIPPATVSFHARVIFHAAGSFDIGSVSKQLESLLPKDRHEAVVLELVPEGSFLTYGIGVSLRQMINPVVALGHVPVG